MVIIAVGVTALANRTKITDWWRLRGYQAPTSISQLASQDTMTLYTQHLFYLNKPQLQSSVPAFRKDCPENESTIVLGCYHPIEDGIYIYNVQDQDLQGVTQVTAAHEVLHAAYDRLSAKERARVDGMLEDYYKHHLPDGRVKDEIKLYEQTEPKSVVNEMHSVFGTEVADLPPALEAYYKQYFHNRGQIVAYSEQYQKAFTDRQQTIAQDDQQLATMKQQISAQEAALQTQQAQVTAAHNQLNALLSSGQTAAYNAGVPAYNAQVNSYNTGVASLRAAIDQYNQLVAQRNAVASVLTTLDKALDTRLSPQATH